MDKLIDWASQHKQELGIVGLSALAVQILLLSKKRIDIHREQSKELQA